MVLESWEGGLLGTVGRGLYAVLCVGVLLVATTFVYYAFAGALPSLEPATDDAQEKSRRRLAALQKADF